MYPSSALFVFVLAAIKFTITGAAAVPEAAAPAQVAAGTDHWCGAWAGSPNPSDVVGPQQLPPYDFTRRFFVEPQLQRVPFAPLVATEPKIQVPKLWGNSNTDFEAWRNFLLNHSSRQFPRGTYDLCAELTGSRVRE
ncbi:MAG: hypothetical protein Q9198_002899 [Flavoplaca austrocitrina]